MLAAVAVQRQRSGGLEAPGFVSRCPRTRLRGQQLATAIGRIACERVMALAAATAAPAARSRRRKEAAAAADRRAETVLLAAAVATDRWRHGGGKRVPRPAPGFLGSETL